MVQHYDVVILDTAPVLTMSDPLALASCAGTLFLLVRRGFTLAELTNRCAARTRRRQSTA